MPWRCKLIDIKELGDNQPKPGDMWHAPWHLDFIELLSDEYVNDWIGKRDPIVVCLPNGEHWCVDLAPDGKPRSSGWKVTGTAPRLTAYPSIAKGNYHGKLTNGVLSDDMENRAYGPLV